MVAHLKARQRAGGQCDRPMYFGITILGISTAMTLISSCSGSNFGEISTQNTIRLAKRYSMHQRPDVSVRTLRGGCYDDQPDTLGVFTIHDLGNYGWKEDWMLEDDQAYMEVYIILNDTVTLEDCKVEYEPFSLKVKIQGNLALNGTLLHRIRPDLCCHEIEIASGRRFKGSRFNGKRCLFIQLAKFQWQIWKTLFVDEKETKVYEAEHVTGDNGYE
ncbi:hypothetical protein AAMO2058_001031000 [Amorphochlora amoebiformis]